MKNDNIVEIKTSDIFWNINVKDTGKKNRNEPIIKLQWGWNPDEDEEMEKEGWHNNSVSVMLSQAVALRDNLNEIIEKLS